MNAIWYEVEITFKTNQENITLNDVFTWSVAGADAQFWGCDGERYIFPKSIIDLIEMKIRFGERQNG